MRDITIEDAERYLLDGLRNSAAKQRWFPGKAPMAGQAAIADIIQLGEESSYFLAILKIMADDGNEDLYQIPLRISEQKEAADSRLSFSADFGGVTYSITDAVSDPEYHHELLNLLSGELSFKSGRGTVSYHLNDLAPASLSNNNMHETRVITSEQSNSSVIFGDRYIYKSFRKLSTMPNPDYEVPYFLNKHSEKSITPRPLAYSIYRGETIRAMGGILSVYEKNSGEAWKYFLDSFMNDDSAILGECRKIGALTSEMHNALSSASDDESFSPELIGNDDVESWQVQYRKLVSETVPLIAALDVREEGYHLEDILGARDEIENAGRLLDKLTGDVVKKIRIHGDYHLGQILKTEQGYSVIDFEGEPARSAEYRRAKNCAIKDLGGLVRSFDYAATVASMSSGKEGRTEKLRDAAVEAMVEQYWKEHERNRGYLPPDREDFEKLLSFFVLEKAVYEMKYEALYRPNWIWIPASSIVEICRKLRD